ncbi:MAG: hypothetical protein GXO64_02410 [Candidatus Micrarchaeota archaeon]|nr:hypothetical protein [Candidatus Micrarchaeota archaeon]
MKVKKSILAFTIVAIFLLLPAAAKAEEKICAVYFSGIGCSHCAKVDPVLLGNTLPENEGNFVLIEYEIFKEKENPQVMMQYMNAYSIQSGVPQIIFNKGNVLRGDAPIFEGINPLLESLKNGNECPLPDGTYAKADEISFSSLPGRPKIWASDRVLIKVSDGNEGIGDDVLRTLLFSKDIDFCITSNGFQITAPQPVEYSGGNLKFLHAAKIGDSWIVEWGREDRKTDDLQKKQSIGIALIILFAISLSIAVFTKERKEKGKAHEGHKKGKKK